MSRHPGHPSLRAEIARQLAGVLSDKSPKFMGDLLGRSETTVPRRGDDLRQWPADELLHLATKFPALGAAVQRFLAGDHSEGDARRVDDGLVESLAALGTLISQSADALRGDRHCSLEEARRLLPIVRDSRALLETVELDLAQQIARGAA